MTPTGPHAPTRVLIVDDHPLVRVGIRQLLSGPDIEVVAEAASGNEALRLLEVIGCDVATLDISMPGRHGVEVLRRIIADHPELPVLIYTRGIVTFDLPGAAVIATVQVTLSLALYCLYRLVFARLAARKEGHHAVVEPTK